MRQRDYMPLWTKFYSRGRRACPHDGAQRVHRDGRAAAACGDGHYPAGKPGERTTMRHEEIEFDIDIEPSFFSLRNLQGGRRRRR